MMAVATTMLLAAAPLFAQALPKSGTIAFDQAREQKLQREVKAANGFQATLFAGPPYAMYPT